MTNTVRRAFRRPSVRLLVAAVAALLFAGRGPMRPTLEAQGPNQISIENQQPGDDDWDISGGGAGGASIQGFASDISVNTGQTVDFKIKTDATNYTIDVYRLGYYGGAGARKVTGSTPIGVHLAQSQVQPACQTDSATGLYDCGNWSVSASWPSTNAVSGVYLAKLTRADNGGGGGHRLLSSGGW